MRATGVRLADGRVFRAKKVISNATRWDTFEKMIGEDRLPTRERLFRKRRAWIRSGVQCRCYLPCCGRAAAVKRRGFTAR